MLHEDLNMQKFAQNGARSSPLEQKEMRKSTCGDLLSPIWRDGRD